jgi:hypothetical protein
MRKLAAFVIVGILGFYSYNKFRERVVAQPPPAQSPRGGPAGDGRDAPVEVEYAAPPPVYRCDGRVRCPQMRSCEEATWFLRNCAGTEMDGDRDGVPCETQWCTGG